jgi:hypothetical protein
MGQNRFAEKLDPMLHLIPIAGCVIEQISQRGIVCARSPYIQQIRAAGITDLRGIAAALNLRGIQTSRGGHWLVSNVKNLADRIV